MLEEGFHIEILAVAVLRVGIVACKECRFHQVEIVPDVVVLLGRDVVISGMLDGNGIAPVAIEPARFLAGIGINLDEITACHQRLFSVGWQHLGDGNTISVDRYLVAKLIAAFVLAIHDDVNWLAPRCIGHVEAFADLESETVSHECLVAIIIDECPFLGFGRTFLSRASEHVVALSVVELDAPRFLREAPGRIASASGRNGIFLDASAIVVGDGNERRHLVHLVARIVTRFGMDADCRQVGYLVPTGIVAFAFVAVEFQFRYVATGIIRTDITDIAKAPRYRDIGIAHHSGCTRPGDEKERNCIEEVRSVAGLENAQLDTSRLTGARTPPHFRYDMSCPQIEADPCVGTSHRRIEGFEIAVEYMSRRVDCRARLACTVINVGRTDGRACQLGRSRNILSITANCSQKQEKYGCNSFHFQFLFQTAKVDLFD